MREIQVTDISKTVAELCISANKALPADLCRLISRARQAETEPLPKSIMDDLLENLEAARQLDIPVCQDTGMAVVFAEVGQRVRIVGGEFEKAINDGVAEGYTRGLLRCSVVSDPFRRVNTGNNTPAVIHTRIVDSDTIRITVAPKGFGSENMSRIKMFTPTVSREDVCGFIADCVHEAGGNPCPPVVVGVGIGGDFEQCALLSKKALCRPVSEHNKDEFYMHMERAILEKINSLGIGPQGFGGKTTALAVAIEAAPTHIASLPVAVNIGCHVTRHASAIL